LFAAKKGCKDSKVFHNVTDYMVDRGTVLIVSRREGKQEY